MMKVRAAAERLLDKYQITQAPVDPESIAEKECVDVRYVEFSGEAANEIHGFYDHEACKIYVNSADSVEEKLFTIAHELGHHILHQEYASGEKYVPRLKQHVDSLEENEADAFAVQLLVPSRALEVSSLLYPSNELAKQFLVTEDVISKAQCYG